MKLSLTAGALAALLAAFPISSAMFRSSHAAKANAATGQHDQPPVGYSDTPQLPGQPWKVHDIERPAPAVVTPGLGAAPPSDAVVLFDGKDLSQWRSGDQPAKWKVEQGYAEVNGTGTIETREEFGDCQLHVEWASPAKVESGSQGRGNSGVFLMGRYEVQVLDSFDNRTYSDGSAASMYGQFPPLVNACRKPGEWQSYDILFKAPRFEGAQLVAPAMLTLIHNGVVVHHGQAFLGATRHREVATYEPHGPADRIALQDHGNPVRFRNIWVRRL
ncbi:MAG: DUF1080 domain-containing protein [Planctomycetes bacterium]|nr:DUF1080 domain-containing protein [Planctomycetota bacterium]